jgi:uncharacterized protein YqhQ
VKSKLLRIRLSKVFTVFAATFLGIVASIFADSVFNVVPIAIAR